MTPPRPAPVVAAAVLLFVVSAELLLAAVGSVTALAFAPPPLALSFVGLGTVAALIARFLLRATVRLWLGRSASLDKFANSVALLGVVATIPALFGAWLIYMAFSHPRPPTRTLVSLVSGVVFLWANAAALFVACWLLLHRAGRYFTWRDAIRPTDDEDESVLPPRTH